MHVGPLEGLIIGTRLTALMVEEVEAARANIGMLSACRMKWLAEHGVLEDIVEGTASCQESLPYVGPKLGLFTKPHRAY